MSANFDLNSTASLKPSTATRTAGFWPYVVKVGILGWGIPVALAVTAMDWYQGVPLGELGVPLALRLVLFGILGGIAFGAVMRKYSGYMDAKAAEKQGGHPRTT